MQQAENLQNPMRQQGNKRKNEKRIQPCHKPILLYKKIAIDFDLKGKKVYCGHNGSGSDRIAFHNYVLEFLASEIDKEYFDLQESRFLNHQNISQLKMFY
jgi:site-specific DNA-methyltransferase (adenine-specific)